MDVPIQCPYHIDEEIGPPSNERYSCFFPEKYNHVGLGKSKNHISHYHKKHNLIQEKAYISFPFPNRIVLWYVQKNAVHMPIVPHSYGYCKNHPILLFSSSSQLQILLVSQERLPRGLCDHHDQLLCSLNLGELQCNLPYLISHLR